MQETAPLLESTIKRHPRESASRVNRRPHRESHCLTAQYLTCYKISILAGSTVPRIKRDNLAEMVEPLRVDFPT
jgi:hypothetical protein